MLTPAYEAITLLFQPRAAAYNKFMIAITRAQFRFVICVELCERVDMKKPYEQNEFKYELWNKLWQLFSHYHN